MTEESPQAAASEDEADGDEDDKSMEWDEYCYVCQDGGNVMCCDGCPQVAHKQCVNLKSLPKGKWFCADCLEKQNAKQQRMSTRDPHAASAKANGSLGPRQATLNQVMQTRATRRSAR